MDYLSRKIHGIVQNLLAPGLLRFRKTSQKDNQSIIDQKKPGYAITNQQENLSAIWDHVLPKGSAAQARAVLELGLDLVLLSPNINEAVHEALLQTPDTRDRNPNLTLAVLGHDYDTSKSEAFKKFRSLFDVSAINAFYEIEYNNYTLSVFGVMRPGEGILIRQDHQLLTCGSIGALYYDSPDIRTVDVETRKGLRSLVMEGRPLLRALPSEIGRAHFHQGGGK